MGGFTGWGNFDGASSASAAPYIRHFIDDCIVVHQFRDKEKVVRSLIANGHDKLYGVHQDDPFALYDHWNRQVSKFSDHPNYVRINVEDYTSEFVNNIVSRVGRGRKIRSIEVPTDTGSNPNEVA